MAWFRVPPLGVRAYIFINNSHLLLTTPINSDIILLYFKKETIYDIYRELRTCIVYVAHSIRTSVYDIKLASRPANSDWRYESRGLWNICSIHINMCCNRLDNDIMKILLDKPDHFCYNIFMFNKRMNVAKELERIKKKKANRKPIPWRLLLAHPLTWILFALLIGVIGK